MSTVNQAFNTEKRFSWLLLVALFLLPFGTVGLSNLVLLAVVLHSAFFLKKADWRQAFRSPIFIFPALYWAYMATSIFWATDTAEGLRQLETKMSFLVATLLMVAARNRYMPGIKQRALLAFLLGNLIAAIAALGVATYHSMMAGTTQVLVNGKLLGNYFTYTHLSDAFMHPGYFSTYIGIAIFIAIYFFMQHETKHKWLFAAATVFMLVFMFLLQGRINILALFAVIGLGALIFAWKKKIYTILLLPLVPILGFLALVLFGSENIKGRFLQFPDFNYDITGDQFNSATYRLAEWSCAMDVIKKHPVVGTGLGDNRQSLVDAYEARGFKKGVENRFNAHNQFIETTIAGGLLGLLFIVAMLWMHGKIAYNNKDYLTLAIAVFFALCLLTESMFERRWAVLLYTLYLPMALALDAKSEK